jgi:hypothetical protein
MAIRLREKYSPIAGEPAKIWFTWLQQVPSLLYVVGGAFLIYRYWKVLHSNIVLVTGALFLAYGLYRFFLVRRTIRRQ